MNYGSKILNVIIHSSVKYKYYELEIDLKASVIKIKHPTLKCILQIQIILIQQATVLQNMPENKKNKEEKNSEKLKF